MSIVIFFTDVVYKLFSRISDDNNPNTYMTDPNKYVMTNDNDLSFSIKIKLPDDMTNILEHTEYQELLNHQSNARRGEICYVDTETSKELKGTIENDDEPNKKVSSVAKFKKMIDTTIAVNKKNNYILFIFTLFDYLYHDIDNIVDNNYDLYVFI